MNESVTIEKAASVSRLLQLQTISFTTIEAQRVGTLGEGDQHLHWDLPVVDVSWRMDDRHVDVHLPFQLKVMIAETSTVIYEIFIGVLVSYSLRDDAELPVDGCRDFAGINGFLHAWPYFRAEVQSLSVKLSYPALSLPVVLVDMVPARVNVGPAWQLTTTPVDALAPHVEADAPSAKAPRVRSPKRSKSR